MESYKCWRIWFATKRRRTYIFAYHKSTNYYKQMQKVTIMMLYFQGMFVQQFPIVETYEKWHNQVLQNTRFTRS